MSCPHVSPSGTGGPYVLTHDHVYDATRLRGVTVVIMTCVSSPLSNTLGLTGA
jgi:hypothetical protein